MCGKGLRKQQEPSVILLLGCSKVDTRRFYAVMLATLPVLPIKNLVVLHGVLHEVKGSNVCVRALSSASSGNTCVRIVLSGHTSRVSDQNGVS